MIKNILAHYKAPNCRTRYSLAGLWFLSSSLSLFSCSSSFSAGSGQINIFCVRCRITVLSWSRWNKCTSSKYYEYSWLSKNYILSSVRKCCVPSFVVFGVWSFQEQKSGLKELTGNSDWNTQQKKRKRCKRPTFLVICNYSLLSTKVWSDSINFRSNNGRMRLLSNQFQNHCVSCFVPREVIWKVESEMIRGGRLGPPDWSLFVRKQFKSIDCFSPQLTYIL